MTDAIRPISIDNRVVVRLHRAFIPPEFSGMAIRALQSTSKVYALGGPFGLQSKSKRHKFYRRDAEGYVGFSAGLVPRVIQHLRRLGVEAQVDDHSRWPAVEQAAKHLPEVVTDENRSLLNTVATSPRGQLVVANRSEMRRRLWDLLSLFKLQRVLIVTINGAERDRLAGDLSASLGRPVSKHDGVQWGQPDRVTVITADFFSGISVVNVDFDVIVFTHPKSVTGDQAFETAVQLNNELLYCLVSPQYDPDELTQLRLEAVCGGVIHDATASPPTVRVVMVEAPPMRVPANLTALEHKRIGIWKNDQRNEFIAEMALAIAGQDIETFQPRRGFQPEHMDLLTDHLDPGIAILVESIEHGYELLRRLPGWTLHTAIPDQDGVLDGGTCHRSIITQAFASQGIYADVMICATGTSSPLMVRGFPSVAQRRAIVLFDVADDFDSKAIRDTGKRMDDYRSRGWTVQAGNEWEAKQDTSELKTCQRQTGATA